MNPNCSGGGGTTAVTDGGAGFKFQQELKRGIHECDFVFLPRYFMREH